MGLLKQWSNAQPKLSRNSQPLQQGQYSPSGHYLELKLTFQHNVNR